MQITPAYDGAPARRPRADGTRWPRPWSAADIDAFVELSGVDARARALPRGGRDGHPPAPRAPPRPGRGGRRAARGAPLRGLRRAGAARRGRGRRSLVVGSRDDTDPSHPLAVAEEYARRLPRATLVVEERGRVAARLAGRRSCRARSPASWISRRGPSRSGRSSRPPRRPPSSPGSCPSRGARGRARPRARPAGRSGGGCPRRRSVNGGIVIRPATGTGQRAMKSPRSAGAMPALPSSPATFTWTSTSRAGCLLELRQRRLGGDGVDQPDRAGPRPSPCGSGARR